MKNKSQNINWANLPTDIVRLIAKFLQEDVDALCNFRLTCKKWLQATAISTILPITLNASPHKELILYFSAVSLLCCRSYGDDLSTSSSPCMVSAVESTKGNIEFSHPFLISFKKRKRVEQFQHHPTSFLLPCLGEHSFYFNQFHSTNLDVAFHLKYVDEAYGQSVYDKVLLVSKHRIPSMDDCGLLALHDGGNLGGYISIKSQGHEKIKLPWIAVERGLITKFDDIILYKGKYLALNRQGKVYTIDPNRLKINDDAFVNYPISTEGRTRPRRRRLVISVSTGTLYLVDRVTEHFLKVYKLVEGKSGNMWELVNSLEDKVLFVNRVYCFFASASEFSTCNLENAIVFTNNAFPKYVETTWEQADATKNGSQIFVFQFCGQNDYSCVPISRFRNFPWTLWSYPSWASDAKLSPRQSQRETEEEEEREVEKEKEEDDDDEETTSAARKKIARAKMHALVPSDNEVANPTTNMPLSAARRDASRAEEPSPSSFVPQLVETNIDMPTNSGSQEKIKIAELPSEYYSFMAELDEIVAEAMTRMGSVSTTHASAILTSTINEQEGAAAKEVSHQETSRNENDVTPPVSRGYTASATDQIKGTDNSITKFQGFDIRSNLFHTLDKIWSKHGNFIENIIIRNGDIVSRALESLATAVLILLETSARSLSDSQADYLESTLSDLQCMHFKVDWLAPYVEKAVQLHKSKPLMDFRDQLLCCLAKVTETGSKLNEELAKVDKLEKKLQEDVANASRLLPFTENVDLDKPVGMELI